MKYIIPALVGLSLLIGTVVYSQYGESQQLGAGEFTELSWSIPTSDAQWAQDIKSEQIDIRPDDVLNEMIVMHTEKLAREEEAYKKFVMCPDCAYYEFYKGFKDSGYTEQEAVAEATKQAQEAQRNALWSVQKLRQSVQRLEKERELRDSGYLIIAGTEQLGADIPPERIRNVRY